LKLLKIGENKMDLFAKGTKNNPGDTAKLETKCETCQTVLPEEWAPFHPETPVWCSECFQDALQGLAKQAEAIENAKTRSV